MKEGSNRWKGYELADTKNVNGWRAYALNLSILITLDRDEIMDTRMAYQ